MSEVGGDRIEGSVGDESRQAAVGKDINQDTTTAQGNVVNVYTTPEKRRTSQRSRKSSGMVATVDERVISKLNEHDVKLAKLEIYREADQQTMLEYKRDLRQDVEEIKRELKPLFGQGILAQSRTSDDKEEKEKVHEQNRFVVRLLVIMAILFGVGVLSFFGLVLWLALNRA